MDVMVSSNNFTREEILDMLQRGKHGAKNRAKDFNDDLSRELNLSVGYSAADALSLGKSLLVQLQKVKVYNRLLQLVSVEKDFTIGMVLANTVLTSYGPLLEAERDVYNDIVHVIEFRFGESSSILVENASTY